VNSSSRSLYAVPRPPVVCLSSVTFVHRTQPVEIFSNVSTPFGILAIREHPRKILRRSSQGNPSVRGLNANILDLSIIEGYISETVHRGKLVLITNRKLYMSFRLAPKSVTLNHLKQRNGPYFALSHPIRLLPGRTAAPILRPMSIVAKRQDGSRCHLVKR